jgi:glycosyltransferase involved in cell wall biosynthesis
MTLKDGGALRLALMIESDGPGGAETVILTLADGLRRAGVIVHPVVLAGGPGWLSGQLQAAGFKVFLPKLMTGIDPIFAIRLARWFSEHRINVAHGHEFTMAFYAGVSGKLANIPHVITMHGGRRYASSRKLRTLLRYSAIRAQTVIGVSESTCTDLCESLKLERASLRYVPNGIRFIHGQRQNFRQKLELSSGTRLLIAVGNLYKVKGHSVLIEALRLLNQNYDVPPWQLGIAGRGEEHERLFAQIHEASLAQRIHLLGLRNDIPDLLAAADGWIMPSLSEGLPMALLEAMAAGLPIIASSVGGIPDIIRPNESGWLVPPNDPIRLAEALAEMLLHPERAARFGQHAKTIASHSYGQEQLISKHLEIYRAARRN